MRFVWLTLWKDLTRLRRDPLRLAFWIGIPLLLAITINAFFGGEQTKPQGRLLVADDDDTFLSNALQNAFSRNPGVVIVVEKVTREVGRARMDRGDASALLAIPKGFQDAFFNDRPTRLELVTNPSQRILPKIVEETLDILVDGSFYLQRIAGDELRELGQGKAPTDDAVVAMNRLGRSLNKYLDPLVVELETAVAADKPARSLAEVFFPGMIFMAMVFLANGLSQDIWAEKRMGTLRRLAATPAPLAGFLVGQVVFVLVVAFCVGLVGLAGMRWVGVPISSLPAAALWLACISGGLYLFLVFASAHARTPQVAGTVSNLVMFPMMMVGGCFFPFESMPAWLARIGQWTPVGWGVVHFREILDGPVRAAGLGASFGAVALLGALVFPLVVRKLRRSFLT